MFSIIACSEWVLEKYLCLSIFMFNKERLKLFPLYSGLDRIDHLGEVTDEGIRFFYGIILAERDKINVFRIHQFHDIAPVQAECIVGGDANDNRSAVSESRLGCHQYR